MAEEIKSTAKEYVEVDRNMAIETSFPETDVRFYDVRKPPFDLYNLYCPETEPIFHRLPFDVAAATSAQVAKLEREPAGGRLKFTTDSKYIILRAEYEVIGRNTHMTLEMTAGFDLYVDDPDSTRYIAPFLLPYKTQDSYEQIVRFEGNRRERSYVIHFPLHSVVKNVYIGIQEDATLKPGRKYRNDKPVIIYGSSIVHGTAATRPGLCYPNMLSRRLNMNCINLGFSGNAKAELPIVEYMRELPMCMFISDYDYNAPNVDYLRATHQRMYDLVREKNPDIPYIMITKPNTATRPNDYIARRDVVIDTYRHARAKGDKHVYFIDGETFFIGKYEDDSTMDGVHPQDLGFSLMADKIESVMRRAMMEYDCFGEGV